MKKIILPGGAGLVGQNLVARLKAKGYSNIIVLDKHRQNIEILKQVQPDVVVEFADLAEPGDWQRHFVGAGCGGHVAGANRRVGLSRVCTQ